MISSFLVIDTIFIFLGGNIIFAVKFTVSINTSLNPFSPKSIILSTFFSDKISLVFSYSGVFKIFLGIINEMLFAIFIAFSRNNSAKFFVSLL